MEKKLGIALVGAGRIGQTHLFALSQVKNVQLLAVVEPNEAAGKKAAEQYHIDYYKDVTELKDRPDIEAVDICVPEEYHLSTAKAAASVGKHILIEKPIAKTYEEAMEMIKVCEEANVRLMVAQTVHSIDRYRVLRNQLQAGKIGELCEVSIRRYAPRTSLEYVKGRVTVGFYIAIHDIDGIMWTTGHKITEVMAYKIDKLNAYGEDGFDILFKFDNGASGTMNMCWFLPAGIPAAVCDIDVIGDKGLIRLSPFDNAFISYTDRASAVGVSVVDGQMQGAFYDQIEHFADAVMNDKPFRVDSKEVAYAVKVVEAILRSYESGKPETV